MCVLSPSQIHTDLRGVKCGRLCGSLQSHLKEAPVNTVSTVNTAKQTSKYFELMLIEGRKYFSNHRNDCKTPLHFSNSELCSF